MAGIKVGIVEDEMIIAQGIANTLAQLGYLTTEPAVSYTEALEMVVRDKPDILLIDIQLSGKKDGIDLAWKLKEDHKIPFIFLTANSDQATVERAKKLCPDAYLVKPFSKDDLYTAIEICLHNFSISNKRTQPSDKGPYLINETLFIKQGQTYIKVLLSEIMYLESDNVYVHVHSIQARFLVRSTLQNYLDLIGSGHFFRVHRGYVVNVNHIQAINAESVSVNGREIPIAKTYREQLLNGFRLG